MITFLADVSDASAGSSSWLIIGGIVGGLVVLANLAATLFQLFRMSSGTDGQRQIEPTQIAGIQVELKAQTVTLNKLDREMGEHKVQVASVARDVADIKQVHRQEIEGVHARISGISRELTSTVAKVEGIQERENRHRSS